MRASKLQPALFGGLVIGVLSALPVISMGNCLCCLWVVLGGMLAAWLLQQNQPAPVEAVDASLTGMLAGVFGAILATLLSIPIQMVMGTMGYDAFRQILEQNPDVPPEVRSMLEQMMSGGMGGALMLFGMLMSSIAYGIVGAVGGALGTVVFKPTLPPPPPPVPGFADSTRPHVPE